MLAFLDINRVVSNLYEQEKKPCIWRSDHDLFNECLAVALCALLRSESTHREGIIFMRSQYKYV